jgi:enamine deaminase RidA (YjgF/YER057c/UK114 family)
VIASRLSDAGARVSSTLLGVARLAFPQLLVEIEATAAA